MNSFDLLLGLSMLICVHAAQLGATVHSGEAKASLEFLQLSYDESDDEDSGTEDHTKMVIVAVLNLIACALCCAFIQAAIQVSKRLNLKLLTLRKHYSQYESLKMFKDFRVRCNEDTSN